MTNAPEGVDIPLTVEGDLITVGEQRYTRSFLAQCDWKRVEARLTAADALAVAAQHFTQWPTIREALAAYRALQSEGK